MSEYYASLNPNNLYRHEREPSFTESMKAAYGYQYSPIIARTQEEIFFGAMDRDPEFNPFDSTDGYEGFESDIARAKNQQHLDFIKQTIDQNRDRRDVLAKSDFFSGALVAGILDPLGLAFALPVVGQLGLFAKGGMTVRQAAAASAKGGVAFGVSTESIRAPFDPINTAGETGLNLLTATAFSTVLGTAGSAVFNTQGAFHRSAGKLRDLTRGEMADEIDGTKIVVSEKMDESVVSDGKSIKVNPKKIEQTFDEKPWMADQADLPEGVDLIPENAFNTPTEYKHFLINRENLKKSDPRQAAESSADFQNRINREALSRTYEGYNLKKTMFTDSIWFKLIPTPAKTILLDKDVPNWLKRDYQLMEGNGAMAMEQNIAGRGTQSIRQRIPVYTVRANNELLRIRREYNKEVLGKETTTQISGVDLSSGQKRKMIGRQTEFDKWFENTVDMYIQASNPEKHAKIMQDASPAQKRTFEFLRQHYDSFLQSSQDVGLLRDVKNVNAHLTKIRAELEELNMREQELDLAPAREKTADDIFLEQNAEKYKEALKKQMASLMEDEDANAFVRQYNIVHDRVEAKLLGELELTASQTADLRAKVQDLEEQIAYYEGYQNYAGSRSKYIFPVYYDKKLLKSSEDAREGLTAAFERYLTKETHYWKEGKGDAPGKWVRKPTDYNPRETAEQIVRNILEENPDDILDSAVSPAGGKHLRHRAIDIPIDQVAPFIIKNESVLYTYAERMGRKIEWTRNFGDKTINDIMLQIESDMKAKGVKETKIAKVKAAFMGDYQRVMGRLIENPDSLTNQAARAIKETAGITYLHSAGLSAVVDTAMLVFERGIGKTIAPLIDKDFRPLFVKAAGDIDTVVDQTGLARGMVQDRYIGDSIRGIQPNAVERVFNPITNAFYNIPLLGNNLGMVTRYSKIVDGVFRQSELIRMSIDLSKNKAKAADVEYLARYGINEDDARAIASMGDVWEVDPSGRFYYANRSKWPLETEAQRNLALRWDTAMNSGVANTIMHATSFDKPLVVDGATYVRWYPWMKSLTLGKLDFDPRVSTQNVKMAKIETGVLGMPFQFMNFTLAATNRITGQMLDPARQHRLQGAVALLGLSYISLSLKKPDWWFESKTAGELTARIADHSGIFGVYADLFYLANHAAIEHGLNDESYDLLKGRYRVREGDSLWDAAGAGPGMVREWYMATEDMLNGYTKDAKSKFYYNTPSLPLLKLVNLNEDMRDFWTK